MPSTTFRALSQSQKQESLHFPYGGRRSKPGRWTIDNPTLSRAESPVCPLLLAKFDVLLIGVQHVAMTQAAVRLELAKQDAKELEDGSVVPLHAEVTCSVFLSTGIDIEHTQ